MRSKKSEPAEIMRKTLRSQFFRKNRLAYWLILVVTIGGAVLNLLISWLMQQIVDLTAGTPGGLSFGDILLAACAELALLVIIMTISCIVGPRFYKRALRQYKDFVFEQITKKNISSFNDESTSTYISALTNDVANIESNYLTRLFDLVEQSLLFVGAFGLMLFYSWQLTLVAVALSILPVIASLCAGGVAARQEKVVSDQNERFIDMVKDSLTGFTVIKSFKAERDVARMFADSNEQLEEAKRRRRVTDVIITNIGSLTGAIAQFGVFLAGAYLAVSGKGVTAGVVIVFVQLMNFVITPIAQVPKIIAGRKAANALIVKLSKAVSANIRREGKTVDKVLDEAIELRGLSFSYEPDAPVLRGVTARFEAGKSYAIVGGSGSGKSTMLSLLMGSRDDYEGEILYDGDELRAISSDCLYDLASIVQQNVFVFNASMRDNITMFKQFDDAQIDRAVKLSGLSGLIESRGYDYPCGEGGSGLSGGERQRLSIARSLLRGTPVLLVDEATAALDAATAFEVTSSILDIPDMTRIVVTHRLEEALLRRYDGILVLRSGRVDEMGTFEQLMAKKEFFYSLFMVSQG